MKGVEHGGSGRLYSCLGTQSVKGKAWIQPKSYCTQIACSSFSFIFSDLNFLTSEIIQTLQKGIKGILLPPPSPIFQAYMAPSFVGVLPGRLLRMYGTPKETSGMTVSSPDGTAVTAEAGFRSELSSSLHGLPG